MILDVKTGKVLGIIGGRQEDEYRDHFNRATQARRQPGSVFKPLTRLYAFFDNIHYRFRIVHFRLLS